MTTTCSFVTQVGVLKLGTNVFSAYLYPDVINGTQFAVRANDVSIDLVLPVAGLRNCRNGPDDYIKFGEFYSCECTNSTQGNLPVLYQWFDESNGVLGAGVLHQVANITGVPSKLFKCQPQYLWNNTLVGTAVLFLAKFAYGPTDVQLFRKDNTNLSEIYNLCPTTGNITFVCHVLKTTVNPEPSITMYQNNLSLSFSTQHNSSSYNYISTFQPRSAGVLVFGCFIENSVYKEINVNTTLQVLVRAPPSTKPEVAITNGIITGTQFILEENNTYEVSCNVDGGVNILISCGALHIETSTSIGKLTLSSVSRNLQNTNCTCTANHITGCYTNNVSWYTLNVTYPAEISNFTANANTGPLTVPINSDVTFECEVNSNPPAAVVVYHRNSSTALASSTIRVSCEDSGEYVCQASNAVFNISQQKFVTIYVLCEQRLKNQADSNKIFHVMLQKDFMLSVEVFGYPAPNVLTLSKLVNGSMIQLFDSGIIDTFITKYKVDYASSVVIPYGSVYVTIYNVTETDLTSYTLSVNNGIGNELKYNFTLIKEETISATSTSVVLPAALGGVIAGLVAIGLIVLILIKRKQIRHSKAASCLRRTQYTDAVSETSKTINTPISHTSTDRGYEDIDLVQNYDRLQMSDGETENNANYHQISVPTVYDRIDNSQQCVSQSYESVKIKEKESYQNIGQTNI